MNYAIILSGGIGTRMQMGDFPKQYLEVEKKPILLYTLEQFQKSSAVEKIVIVAADAWREKIRGWMEERRSDHPRRRAASGERTADWRLPCGACRS